ncbi:MAG: LLM class flavin-dependent oxidoreductase [SAR202 cluster bacterium]|jgi:hypothetical protein|nr:LLM class flavin-dependent oxidoreductase [SAR202 cluster bacterium]MDP6514868.1 LLM class flavin-dependent oxidoreductase [SAR202 cluster bacterium]MDP6716409.1 LLM class flavin-dependent oxidoreductase [SAR202 cluster bacterium]
MKFGVSVASYTATWDSIRASIETMEAGRWGSLWVPDHFIPPSAWKGAEDQPMHEAFTLIAAAAGMTEKLRLGHMVAGNTYRNPGLVAKMATTIDQVSHGRFTLSVGATPVNDALPGLIQLAVEGPEGAFKGEEDSGADVIGAMHSKVAVLGAVLEAVQAHGWDGPMLAYPDDVQKWDPVTAKAIYSNDPVDVFSAHCVNWRRDFPKCSILGACCGYSVKHIAALDQRLRMEFPDGKF